MELDHDPPQPIAVAEALARVARREPSQPALEELGRVGKGSEHDCHFDDLILAPPQGAWRGWIDGPETARAVACARELVDTAGPSATIEQARRAASPLVLFGPPGVGKTRVLAGLAGDWLDAAAGRELTFVASSPPQSEVVARHRTVWMTAEGFGTACERAERAGIAGWERLRRRIRGVGLLALDDLEGLRASRVAQRELIATLDALREHGGVAAVTARGSPARLAAQGWSRRLVNRLVGGLAVRLEPPSLETRRRAALERAGQIGSVVVLNTDAIEWLAAHATTLPELDGLFYRVRLMASLQGGLSSSPRIVDRADVADWLTDLVTPDVSTKPNDSKRHEGSAVPDSTARIAARIAATAKAFGLKPTELRGPRRSQRIAQARATAVWLALRVPGATIAGVGRALGGRDPATIRHARTVADARRATDPAYAALLDHLDRH